MATPSSPGDCVAALMQRSKRVLGVAVIDKSGIAWSLQAGGPPGWLFQAGSISKPVTALVALELAARGQLDLDGDVNDQLTSWRLPGPRRVTLRQLLGHTAGLASRSSPDTPRGPACRRWSRSWTACRPRRLRPSGSARTATAGSAIPAAGTPSCSS
jgi:CubicO group peptidase (beta-lactamase class C family)